MNLCALFAVVATLVAFTSNAYGQGIEVKGITLGEPESALERGWGNPPCKDVPTWDNEIGDRVCRELYSSYGGAEVMMNFYILGGTIESIDIRLKPDEFDAVITAMKSRLGSSTTDRTEGVMTRAGVPYKNRIVGWARKDGAILGQRYSESISESIISFSSNRYQAEFAKRRAAKQKARGRDL